MEPSWLYLTIALLIVAAAVFLRTCGGEIRLVLLAAALVMFACAGKPLGAFDILARGMVSGLVAPICSAMGFAAVLSATKCDQHLVRLLLKPLQRVRRLMLPGAVLAAYVVNAAIPSQAAAAAAIGPILIPLMIAAGVRKEVAGAALLLGASFGGDLLNPGDQNVQAVAAAIDVAASDLTSLLIPTGIAGVTAAAVAFGILNRTSSMASGTTQPPSETPVPQGEFRLNLLKAAVPLVPIALLLLAYTGWSPLAWLLVSPLGPEWIGVHGVLPVVRAMFLGTLLAAVVSWREWQSITISLFDGMGHGYAKIISFIISAQCFGAGLAALGVSRSILDLFSGYHGGLASLSLAFPWGLAVLSGSGSGPIFTFAETFLKEVNEDHDKVLLGALCCLAGSFGRTMSPVAPIVLYCSSLVDASPFRLVRLVLLALLVGAGVSLLGVWICN